MSSFVIGNIDNNIVLVPVWEPIDTNLKYLKPRENFNLTFETTNIYIYIYKYCLGLLDLVVGQLPLTGNALLVIQEIISWSAFAIVPFLIYIYCFSTSLNISTTPPYITGTFVLE